MWEGQVEGKGATYGRRLWFLLQRKKRKLPQAEIRRAWNTLTGRERELICPTAPERLPDSSRGSRQVGNDLWRLGRDTESLGFLDRYQGLFSVRQRACRVPDQQILAWRDEHKSVVQIIELSGLPLVPDQIKRSKNLVNQAIGRARRRRGDKPKAGACGHTPTPLCSRRNDLWREWYEKEKLGPAKILDRWNALGAVERVKYVDDPKYAASLPATFGMRVQSQQRIWQAIQRAKRQRELNVTQPQAALPTGNDEKTKPAAPPPIVAAAHQAKKRRNREKTSQTVKIEAAYKAGADVNQVVARFGISKDYAWQIRYRMKLKVRRET
jgi:hypothetical protein